MVDDWQNDKFYYIGYFLKACPSRVKTGFEKIAKMMGVGVLTIIQHYETVSNKFLKTV